MSLILFNDHLIITIDDVVDEIAREAMSPLSDRSLYCVEWLRDYFSTYGDWKPNGDQCNLCSNNKKASY